MSRTADIVVVGDGIVGASIAYYLAAAELDVVLLRGNGQFQRSATRHSAGQIRMHHSDPHEASMAALSLEVFEYWPELIGGECGFVRSGFAYLVDEAHTGILAGTVAELTNLGVDNVVLDPVEFGAGQPALNLAGVAALAYEPGSGYADPALATTTLIERANALGASVLGSRTGALLTRSGERITGAIVDGERISAGMVVLAAGANSARLAGAVGVDLPLSAQRVGWAIADSTGMAGADRLPMVIDDVAGMYFRPAGPGRLLFRIPLDGNGLSDRVAEAKARLATRLPGLASAPVLTTAGAAEAYTADGRALIGRPARHPGLYLATGFNGGGFKLAPAVGQFVCLDLASGAEPAELKPYRPDRFAAGDPAPAIKRYQHM